MKLINKTDPRFADSVVRGGRFFFDKRHQADDSSVIHGVNKIYNSPLSLSKSISCPSPSNAYPCINRPKKGISSFSPMHNSTDPINLSPYHEVITTTSTLFYNDLADDYALDAKNYFYLGSFETCSVLHQGITLDEFGNLLLVKGKSKGLLKYLWKKVRGKLRFYWARIILKDFPQLTFDRILVNGQGQLVAKVKGCNQYYSVSLSTKNIVKHFDIDEVNDMSSSISLCLRKTEPIREHPNGLLVRHDGYRSVLLKSQEGSLFLEQQEHKPSDRGHQVNLTQPKRLALPLSADSQVDSVCGEFDVFKIVVIHGFHKRVYYINPRDIDIHLAKVKKISHKPPQAFVTAMGGDPYEKVYSGLPFDCGRLGNFSSRHLPLISVPVDKFRQKAKAAKKHYYVGNTRQAAVKWIQAIDPGIPFLAKTIRRAVKKKPVSSMRDISRCFKDEIGDMRCVGLSHGMDRVFDSVSGDLDVRWLIKEKIKDTIFSLEPKDSISLCDIFEASFFFGIAAAGIPFMPGWFGGILYRVQKGAKVVFTKLENGNIKLIYEKDHAKSWIGLLGTGQGLEDHCKLITINDVDLGTVLPIEMNLILVQKVDLQRNFSFDFAAEHLDDFLGCLFLQHERSVKLEQQANNILLKVNKKKSSKLLIEGKCELRAQVGFMANPSTFLVLPRSALGIGGELSFFDSEKQKEVTVANQESHSQKHITTQNENHLGSSLFAFRELKIMPIPMFRQPDISDNLFCLPMPLLEAFSNKVPVTRHPLARYFRIDGATMRLNVDPMVTNSEIDAGSKPKTCPFSVMNHDVMNMPSSLNYLLDKESRVPENIRLILGSILEGFSKAGNNSHGYQEIKSGANISTFVLSKGDYKANLAALGQRRIPQVRSLQPKSTQLRSSRIKQSLAPWTKNTTLGEFLALKDRALASQTPLGQKVGYTSYEFIQSLERYAGSNRRDSLDKQYQLIAVATYQFQAEALQHIKEELATTLACMRTDIQAGVNLDHHLASLHDYDAVFNVAKPQDNPFLQLDTIALIRQSTLMRRSGTLPCGIINIAHKRGATHSAHLESIKLEYRRRELFPYRLSSTLTIMPDLQ